MGRKRTNFQQSARYNNLTCQQYVNRLLELSMCMFEWKNLPPTVDPRYMELELLQNGSIIYFNDSEIGDLCLTCTPRGQLDVYGEPLKRRAYSRYNNYQRELTNENSVIIWNNFIRSNSLLDIEMFAKRLYNIDRIIDVNVNTQKTPVLLQGSETQRLTLTNLYKEYDGNAPVIYGDKNLDINGLSVLKTDAPYVADKLYELKTQIWNEALTYLGIANTSFQKRERMLLDEVRRNMGGTIANRYNRLKPRQEAVEKINAMFGTNIVVDYSNNLDALMDDVVAAEEDAFKHDRGDNNE